MNRVRVLVADWSGRMTEAVANGPRHGTRWGRSLIAVLPAAAAVASLGTAIAEGALAAGVNVNGSAFTLLSNGVQGTGFGAILNTPNVENSNGTTTATTGMARVGFASAQLDGLCGIIQQNIGGVSYSLLLTAGHTVAATPPQTLSPDINAADLYIQATQLAGTNTTLQNAVLGLPADQVLVDNKTLTGSQPGGFGLGSAGGPGGSSVTLTGLNASAYDAEIAGSLSLPGLKIRVVGGQATSC